MPAGQVREEFAKIAADMSDCSSAKKGGDLGFFGPGQMQKAFEVSKGASPPDFSPCVIAVLTVIGRYIRSRSWTDVGVDRDGFRCSHHLEDCLDLARLER